MQVSPKNSYSAGPILFYAGVALLATSIVAIVVRLALTHFQQPRPDAPDSLKDKKITPKTPPNQPAPESPPPPAPDVSTSSTAPPSAPANSQPPISLPILKPSAPVEKLSPLDQLIQNLKQEIPIDSDAAKTIKEYRDQPIILGQIVYAMCYKNNTDFTHNQLTAFLGFLEIQSVLHSSLEIPKVKDKDRLLVRIMYNIETTRIGSSEAVGCLMKALRGVKVHPSTTLQVNVRSCTPVSNLKIPLEDQFWILGQVLDDFSSSLADIRVTARLRNELTDLFFDCRAVAQTDLEASNKELGPIFEYLNKKHPLEVAAHTLVALAYTYHPYFNHRLDFQDIIKVFLEKQFKQFEFLLEKFPPDFLNTFRSVLRMIVNDLITTKNGQYPAATLFWAIYYEAFTGPDEIEPLYDMLLNYRNIFVSSRQGIIAKTDYNQDLPLAFVIAVLQQKNDKHSFLAYVQKKLPVDHPVWKNVNPDLK